MTDTRFSRRHFVAGSASLLGLTVAGCQTTGLQTAKRELEAKETRSFALNYSARPNEKFPIPAVKRDSFPSKFHRRLVKYDTKEKVGSLIVDSKNFYLYHVRPEGKAMRYGVGLGRAGFEWSGRARVAWSRKWPTWTPPPEMIEREPELEKYSWQNGGMPPGLKNPLGSRALYIFEGKVDTLYRLHGTPNPQTIGKAVSSGCVRLVNQDVIHLYENVKRNSPILVLPA